MCISEYHTQIKVRSLETNHPLINNMIKFKEKKTTFFIIKKKKQNYDNIYTQHILILTII